MASDIFSRLDVQNYLSYSLLFWVGVFCFVLLGLFCFMGGDFLGLCGVVFFSVNFIFKGVLPKRLFFGGFVGLLLLIITTINFFGIFPYVLGVSSHLLITVSLGFVFWGLSVYSSLMNNSYYFVASFLPSGAPLWLNPVLCLIELIRVFIRPITLSVRLAANMTAGHVILSLLSSLIAGLGVSYMALLFSVLCQVFYMIFEVFVCFIQAFIFSLLLSIYFSEHS